ncbi:MAG: DUF1566 domain-containing protein [Desulfobulbus sp.]
MFVRSHIFVIAWTMLFISVHSANADSLEVKGEFIYDSAQNLCWTKNANLNNGKLDLEGALEWINELNEIKYGGYSDWRLPYTPDGVSEDGAWRYDNNVNSTKYNVTVSELGHLFYEDLQLQGRYSSSGTKNTDYGLRDKDTPFDNLQSDYYWFGTPTKIGDASAVWLFDFESGIQFKNTLGTDTAYAIAVRSALHAPEPSSAALFLIGLFPLVRIQCRQNH